MQQKKPATRPSVRDEGGAGATAAQQELPRLLYEEYYLMCVRGGGNLSC